MAEFRPVNLAEIYGQIDAARANQANMENNRMMQERQRRQFAMEDEALAEQRAIKDVYGKSIDNVDGMPQLNKGRLLSEMIRINPAKAMELQDSFNKQESESLRLKSETAKAQLENRKATAAYLRDRLAGVQDQATYDAVMQEAQELGAGFVQGAPREFNPEFVRGQLFTADEFLKQSTPKYEKVDLGGKIQIIDVNPMTNPSIKGTALDKTATPDAIMTDRRAREEGALNRGVTIRGQNLTDARARETNAGGAKAPSGYRFLANGNLEPIPGGPGEQNAPKLQEGERKAATLLSRLRNSQQQLNEAIKTSPSAAKPELTSAGIRAITPGTSGEALANTLTSDARQQVESAQLDILDAALTLGTGAAYTKEQLEGYRKSYFPQIGDSKKAVKDKQDRLNNIIKAAEIAAGRGAELVPKTQTRDVRSEADKILGL